MNIDISKLISGKTEYVDIKLDYDLNASELLQDFNIAKASPIVFSGKIYKENENIFIDISFSGEVVFRCSRCLNEFKDVVSGHVKFDIPIVVEDDEDNAYIKDNCIDLSLVLEEALAFSLPMKVVCKEECKGLCSICGKNLNIKECDCNLEKIDPRLEKLKYFFSKNEEV